MENERKRRIEEKIRQAGYKSDSEFQIRLAKEVDPSMDPYESLKSKKGNFSKKVSGERSFSEDEIIAMEKLLSCSFYDMIEEKKTQFSPRGIRYAAYCDDISLLGSIEKSEGIPAYDEYDKTFLDYVLEFKSKASLGHLIESGKLKPFVNYRQYQLSVVSDEN